MLIKIYSAAPVGIEAVKVTIEVHSKPGFEFIMVGLPDTSVKESHERIMAALTVNGLEALHPTVRTLSTWPLLTSRKKARYMISP